jgi:hypothetical protein
LAARRGGDLQPSPVMMESQPLQEPTATAPAAGEEAAGAPPAVVSAASFLYLSFLLFLFARSLAAS